MIKDKNKSTGFIDFLNNEFQGQKTMPVVVKLLPKQTINTSTSTSSARGVMASKEKSAVKKTENVFGKKSNVKNRLANASKLIKTMEVFLDGKSTEMQVDYVTFEGWDEIYKNMKVNIHKDVEDLIRKKGYKKTKKTFSVTFSEKLEYAPQGNILNYSVMVMSVLMLSFFSTAIFPGFTNKSISTIDSLFDYPINKIVKMNAISNEFENAPSKKGPEAVTREQLAEYIKKNFDRIKNNQTVPVEDITGQVAGVAE